MSTTETTHGRTVHHGLAGPARARKAHRRIAWLAVALLIGGGLPSPWLVRPASATTDTVHTLSGTQFLHGVDCVDDSHCVAVGTGPNGGVVVPVVDGAPGTPVIASNTTELRGVRCPSSTSCVAVGYARGDTSYPVAATIAVASDGSVALTALDLAPIPHTELYAVNCVSVTRCVATGLMTFQPTVSGTAGVAATIDTGSITSFRPVYSTQDFHGVSCYSTTRCLLVGRGQDGLGLAVAYADSGTRFSNGEIVGPPLAVPNTYRLSATSCDATRCVTAGNADLGGAVSIVVTPHDDGTLTGTASNDLGGMTMAYGVTCLSARTCAVVGQHGASAGSVAVVQDGVTTTSRDVTGTTTVRGMTCPSVGQCQAVGNGTSTGQSLELRRPDETPPVITSLSPAADVEAGGAKVKVTGSDLGNAFAVTFGGAPGTELSCTSDTTCTVTAPAGRNVVNVVATSEGGPSAPGTASRFAYVHGVTVLPDRTTASAGQAAPFKLYGSTADGSDAGELNSEANFSISPDGSCTGSSCSATTAGAHTVTGTYKGLSDTAAFDVTAGAAASLSVSPATSTITAGGSRSYTAFTRDQYGNTVADVTRDTTFSLAGGSCSKATCTSTVAGSHTLTATWTSYTAHGTLTVTAGPLASLTVTPAGSSTAAGSPVTFAAEGHDAYGNTLGSKTSSATWTIAPDGSCTGSACGSTTAGAHTVTATIGAVTASTSLAVTPAGLDHLVLSPAKATVVVGAGQPYTAMAVDRYGNSLGDVTERTAFNLAGTPCSAATCTPDAVGTLQVTGLHGTASGTAALVSTYAVNVLAPTTAVKAGASYPIRLQLFDATGLNRSSSAIAVTLVGVTPSVGETVTGTFTYKSDLGETGGYQYLLRTKGWKPGTYTLLVRASGDPVVHAIPITLT